MDLIDQTVDTPLFSLSGLTVDAKIVYIVDGDTVDAVFMYNKEYHKFRLRLYGINTPETKGPERTLGIFVKKIVNTKLLDVIVKLDLHEFDNFGRLLSVIHINELNFNEYLVQHKYACNYENRKQHVWEIDLPCPLVRTHNTRNLFARN